MAIHFDVDQQQAVKTRERVLKHAAQGGYWVAAAHISFPGLGHVKSDSKGYRWVAANYTTQLAPDGQSARSEDLRRYSLKRLIV